MNGPLSSPYTLSRTKRVVQLVSVTTHGRKSLSCIVEQTTMQAPQELKDVLPALCLDNTDSNQACVSAIIS